MKVILYNVGRNLNRAYRTCFSFGITELLIVGKENIKQKGALYSAKKKVKIVYCKSLDDLDLCNTVAFENYYKKQINNLEWKGINFILIGGETGGLPRELNAKEKICIPTANKFCLTVEASLAIVLYEWSKNANKM